jgi:hypothetical protein
MNLQTLRVAVAGMVLTLPSAAPLWAQSAPPPGSAQASAAQPLDAAAYVRQQFGEGFKIDARVTPMTGDLDGDGNEDRVLVATSARPLDSQEDFHYRVLDPFDDYYGIGDPKITSQFTIHQDGSDRDLLVVEGWRLPESARKPKQLYKFVFINTPMQTIRLTRYHKKKKTRDAIDIVDNTGMRAYVEWDGKHWRWKPHGMVDDLAGFGAAEAGSK